MEKQKCFDNSQQTINQALSTLQKLPKQFQVFETQCSMILYFLLITLKILNSLDQIPQHLKQSIIDWIYSQQIYSDISDIDLENYQKQAGFIVIGPQLGMKFHKSNTPVCSEKFNIYHESHIVSTFTSIISLLILEDSMLQKVRINQIIYSIKCLFNYQTGCFKSTLNGYEQDVRFTYSSLSVLYIISEVYNSTYGNLIKSLDCIDCIVKSIERCQNFDGGFGLQCQLESQGGATFCSIASLKMLDKLNDCKINKQKLIEWLINRYIKQYEGFQGRPNKIPDVCYTYWIGASLEILGFSSLVNSQSIINFLTLNQDFQYGGFKKNMFNRMSDPIHTGLALMGLGAIQNYQQIDKQSKIKNSRILFGF